MKQRSLALFCALCLLSSLLTGCWQGVTDVDSSLLPVEEEPITATEPLPLPAEFALPYSAGQTLDPVTCADGMQRAVGALLYEGLFALDEQFEPRNVLCDTDTYDPVTFTHTFTLRSGVTFSNGAPLTAADVVDTLQRAKTSPRYQARLATVQSISAEKGGVVIRLSGGNTRFSALLDIPIVQKGSQTGLVPLGTGPYCFRSDDTGASLVANENWWGSAPLPVATIRLVDAKDQDNMLYQLTSHSVQLITADLTSTSPISASGNVSFQEVNTSILQYVGFNTRRAPFDSVALRQALGKGINRRRAVNSFLSGHALATQFPLSPTAPLYPLALEKAYSYNAFQSAMTAAGYNSGSQRNVTLLVNEENAFKVSIAQEIAASLSAFDLQVTLNILPWEAYTAALAAGNFDLYYGEVKLTADWNLSRLLGTNGALNYGGFSDALTDQLLQNYATATNSATVMTQLCAQFSAQAPLLPICFKSTSVLSQTDVITGLTPTAENPFHNLQTITIALEKD